MLLTVTEVARQKVNKFIFGPFRCLSFALFHSSLLLFFFLFLLLSFFSSFGCSYGNNNNKNKITVNFKYIAEKSFARSAFNILFFLRLIGEFYDLKWNTVVACRFILIPIFDMFSFFPTIEDIFCDSFSMLFNNNLTLDWIWAR